MRKSAAHEGHARPVVLHIGQASSRPRGGRTQLSWQGVTPFSTHRAEAEPVKTLSPQALSAAPSMTMPATLSRATPVMIIMTFMLFQFSSLAVRRPPIALRQIIIVAGRESIRGCGLFLRVTPLYCGNGRERCSGRGGGRLSHLAKSAAAAAQRARDASATGRKFHGGADVADRANSSATSQVPDSRSS